MARLYPLTQRTFASRSERSTFETWTGFGPSMIFFAIIAYYALAVFTDYNRVTKCFSSGNFLFNLFSCVRWIGPVAQVWDFGTTAVNVYWKVSDAIEQIVSKDVGPIAAVFAQTGFWFTNVFLGLRILREFPYLASMIFRIIFVIMED